MEFEIFQPKKTPTEKELKDYISIIKNKITSYRNNSNIELKKKLNLAEYFLRQKNLIKAQNTMETIIQEEDLIKVYDILTPICEILLKRIYSLITPEFPPDLRPQLDSMIYAATRINFPELINIREIFKRKYGLIYIQNADNNVDNFVNSDLVERLKKDKVLNTDIRLKQLCKSKKINFEFPNKLNEDINNNLNKTVNKIEPQNRPFVHKINNNENFKKIKAKNINQPKNNHNSIMTKKNIELKNKVEKVNIKKKNNKIIENDLKANEKNNYLLKSQENKANLFKEQTNQKDDKITELHHKLEEKNNLIELMRQTYISNEQFNTEVDILKKQLIGKDTLINKLNENNKNNINEITKLKDKINSLTKTNQQKDEEIQNLNKNKDDENAAINQELLDEIDKKNNLIKEMEINNENKIKELNNELEDKIKSIKEMDEQNKLQLQQKDEDINKLTKTNNEKMIYLISELSKKDGIINDLEIKIKDNELKGQKEENFERNKLYFLEIIKNPGQYLQNKFDIC
jgi:hypothetical protein